MTGKQRAQFNLFLLGRTIDLVGGSMTPMVLTLAVLETSGSVTEAGLVGAANMVPMLVLMLPGGAVADRFNRRVVLSLSKSVLALVQASMAVVLVSQSYSLSLLVTLSGCAGVMTAFGGPALRGMVPELVPAAGVRQANAKIAGSSNAVRLCAPVIGGLLVSTVGGGWALAADAATSMVAAVCYLSLRTPRRATAPANVLAGMRSGFQIFISTRWIWISSFGFALTNALVVAPTQLVGPALVVPRFGQIGWGVFLSATTCGGLLSGLALMRWPVRRPLVAGRLIGLLAAAPLLGLSGNVGIQVLVLLAFMGGLGVSALGITYDSTLHTQVPLANMSAVSAIDDLVAFAAIPLAQVLVGPLAGIVGSKNLVFWCALALIIVMTIPLCAKSIRQMVAP